MDAIILKLVEEFKRSSNLNAFVTPVIEVDEEETVGCYGETFMHQVEVTVAYKGMTETEIMMKFYLWLTDTAVNNAAVKEMAAKLAEEAAQVALKMPVK